MVEGHRPIVVVQVERIDWSGVVEVSSRSQDAKRLRESIVEAIIQTARLLLNKCLYCVVVSVRDCDVEL